MRGPMLLGLLLLSGCQTCPAVTPAERVVTQTVKVPVAVARVVPHALLDCWPALPPPPAFKDAVGGLLLPSSQIRVLLAAEAAQRRCDDAWRAWATSN